MTAKVRWDLLLYFRDLSARMKGLGLMQQTEGVVLKPRTNLRLPYSVQRVRVSMCLCLCLCVCVSMCLLFLFIDHQVGNNPQTTRKLLQPHNYNRIQCAASYNVENTEIHFTHCLRYTMNPKSTSNQSSKPCTVLQYPSKKENTETQSCCTTSETFL